MQFMDKAQDFDFKGKRATVHLGADYSQFTDAIPGNGVALGTVTIGKHSGALVYLHDIGFIMIKPNRVHRLNDHRIRGAIVQVQQEQPLDLTSCSAEVRQAIERAEAEFRMLKQQRYEKILQDRQRETERQRQERQKQKQD